MHGNRMWMHREFVSIIKIIKINAKHIVSNLEKQIKINF